MARTTPVIEVEPYQQERWRKRSKIKIYYVGVKFHQDHAGDPPPVNIKGMPIPFPKLGEHLDIDEVYARDLIQKSRYQQKPVYIAERDGGADVAKLIKQAVKEGTKLADIDLNKVKAKHEVKQMSDEDLIDVLKSRASKIDPAVLRELLNEVPMEPANPPSPPLVEVPRETDEEEIEAAPVPTSKKFTPKRIP